MTIDATVVTLAIPAFLIVLAKGVAIVAGTYVVLAVIAGFFYPGN